MTRGIRNVDSKRALEREALISMLEGREILVFFFFLQYKAKTVNIGSLGS